MEFTFLVVLVLVIGLFAWSISTHNHFIRLEKVITESWANVDVALKRRHDLIPNLVETVKGYAAHEKEVLDRVIQARSMAIDGGAPEENELARATSLLLARAEAYPDLRSSENFLNLQRELINTEDRIAAAMRIYNSNVRDFNAQIQMFPGAIMAGNRSPGEFYEVESIEVREPIKVNL